MKNLNIVTLEPIIVDLTQKSTNFIDTACNDAFIEFTLIMNAVSLSNGEEDLRIHIEALCMLFHFKIGFGSHHMWVKQINRKTEQISDNQVLVITF